MKPKLYLMMGLPGAGKTTAAKIIEKLTGAVRLTSDEARLMLFDDPVFTEDEHQQLYEYLNDQTERLLVAGKSVIYDANLNRQVHREEKYQLARAYNAPVVLLWIQTPKNIAKTRAIHKSRSNLWKKTEAPERMFERVASTIEEPSTGETAVTLDGTVLSEEYIKQKLNL